MAERAYIVTKGVVLRETETKEADKILTLLTADRGKISVIARGVRRKSCKYAACAQQMVYSEWTLYQKGEWYYANEGATAELFNGLRTNLEALALGAPVALANATCLPELYGDTARYFDPYDYDTDLDKLAAQPVAAPDEVLQKYSWDRTANFWLHEIEKYAKM